jgi:hypothetical protein
MPDRAPFDRGHLAVRQARLRVQQRRRRLRLGADLAGGRPQGVGGLQGVPALHAPAAPGAVTDRHPGLAHERPAGDLGLELLGPCALDEAAPAVRAGVGERGLVAFADLLRRRRRAMAVPAVRRAGLAARRLGAGLGRPLAEGGGLPFAGTQGVLKAPAQFRDLGFEFGDALQKRLAAGTGRLFHTDMVATRRPVSCASGPPGTTALPTGALNNDDKTHLSSCGQALDFLHRRGVLTEKMRDYGKALYGVLSNEGVHAFKSEREYVRLCRNTVAEYALVLFFELERRLRACGPGRRSTA